MKTIEVFSNGRTVQFTTKSVTIDGKEYPYSHISELRHSEAKRIYGFKCDNDVVMLPYEEKDTQALKVIFSRVQQMHRKPAPAKAGQPAAEMPEITKPAPEPVAEAPVTEPIAEEPVAEPAAETPAEVPVAEPIAEVPAEEPAAEVPAEEPAAEVPAGEIPAAEAPAEPPAEEPTETPALSEKELRKEQKRKEKEQRKADKEAAKREKQAQKAGGSVTYTDTESGSQTVPPETPGRFKKAIIIFIIVLAVFALLGVAYYFFIGPASDPQIGPNATDQTQYNDIDDMINDLEN